jgi:RHS repeat-associated protein
MDGEGRPSTVRASSGVNPVSSTSYNPAGQPTDITFGSGDPVHFGFDANTGRMTQYKLTINGTATYGNLTWNADGALGNLTIVDPFNSSDAQACNYSHDDLARLASAYCGATITEQNFTYDPFGNITKTVPSGATGFPFQPGYNEATNHYTDGATYDADGNLTNDGTDHVYTWDAYGDPITLDSLNLIYDAFGREVEKKSGSSYTEVAYGPTGKLALMNGQTQAKAFVALPGGTQVKYVGSSISTYRLPDWLGSFRIGSNPNRTYSWGVAFGPFGEQYAQSGSPALSFTGEEGTADTVTDEYDFLSRKLHSKQGRWISPDPGGVSAVDLMNPQSWNRYAYVYNNPLALTDPQGLCAGGGSCSSDGSQGGTGTAGGGWVALGDFGSLLMGFGQQSLTYTVDGVETFAELALGMISSGTASQCLNNDCNGYGKWWKLNTAGDHYLVNLPYPATWTPNPKYDPDGPVSPDNMGGQFHNLALWIDAGAANNESQLSQWMRGLIFRPWSFGILLPIEIPAGPAGTLSLDLDKGFICLGGGGGVGGRGANGGPLWGDTAKSREVLSGASVSVNVAGPVGVQRIENLSGKLYGLTGGSPGVSVAVTYSWCSKTRW